MKAVIQVTSDFKAVLSGSKNIKDFVSMGHPMVPAQACDCFTWTDPIDRRVDVT